MQVRESRATPEMLTFEIRPESYSRNSQNTAKMGLSESLLPP
jgi:hypothetical protein